MATQIFVCKLCECKCQWEKKGRSTHLLSVSIYFLAATSEGVGCRLRLNTRVLNMRPLDLLRYEKGLPQEVTIVYYTEFSDKSHWTSYFRLLVSSLDFGSIPYYRSTKCPGHKTSFWGCNRLRQRFLVIINHNKWLVARRVTLVVVFAFLSQHFGKVVGAYEWYYVSLWVQFQQLEHSQIGGWFTQTLIAIIKFVWTFLLSQVVGTLKHLPCARLHSDEPPGESFHYFKFTWN